MRTLRKFLRAERGAVTTEFVTLFPVYAFFLLFFTDASVLYLTYTEMFNVSREASRRAAVGALHVDDVPAYIAEHTHLGQRTYTTRTFSGSTVAIDVTVEVGDASVFGILAPIIGRELQVRILQMREPTPEPTPL